MTVSFIIVSDCDNDLWINTIAADLKQVGDTQIVGSDDEPHMSQGAIPVFLVDSTSVSDMETVVTRLREEHSIAPILVVTASPTWQRARSAFESGASDYLSKSTSVRDFLMVVATLLERTYEYSFENVDPTKELRCAANTLNLQMSH